MKAIFAPSVSLIPILLSGCEFVRGCGGVIDSDQYKTMVAKSGYGAIATLETKQHGNFCFIGASPTQEAANETALAECRAQFGNVCHVYAQGRDTTAWGRALEQESTAQFWNGANGTPSPETVKTPEAQQGARQAHQEALPALQQEQSNRQVNSQSEEQLPPSPTTSAQTRQPSAYTPTQQISPQPKGAPSVGAAHFTYKDGYESDGAGGLEYHVYVTNDGQVALNCKATATGLVWQQQADGSTQSTYSTTMHGTVYPGQTTSIAGFNAAVANSGSYTVSCARSN